MGLLFTVTDVTVILKPINFENNWSWMRSLETCSRLTTRLQKAFSKIFIYLIVADCLIYFSVSNVDNWLSICLSVLENKATYFDFIAFKFIFSFLRKMKPIMIIPSNTKEHIETNMNVISWLFDRLLSLPSDSVVMSVSFEAAVDNVVLGVVEPVWTEGYYGP